VATRDFGKEFRNKSTQYEAPVSRKIVMLELLNPVPVHRKMPSIQVRFIAQLANIVLKIGIVHATTPSWLWSTAVAFVQARPTMPGVGATTLRIGTSLSRPLHIRIDDEELEDSCC